MQEPVQQETSNARESLLFLSVLSSLAVVFLHFNAVFWWRPTGLMWLSANLIETVCYFAVPIFFMISGCNLLDYGERYNTWTFFLKRIKKVLVPFVLWSFIALGYVAQTSSASLASLSWSEILWGLLDARYMAVYWFFMPLFSLYLLFPLFTSVQEKMRVFGYCAGLGVLLMSVLPFVAQWFEMRVFPKGFAMPFGCGYLLYPLLGYVLYYGRMTRRWRWMIYLGGLVGMGIHCGVTLYATPEAGAVNLLVKGYLKPPAILQACALFLFVKEALPKLLKKAWMQRLLRFFAPTTFGIYLTHMYAFFFLSSLFDPTTLAFRLCLPPLVFVGLACIIRGVQHLTWGRWFLPR